MDAQAQIGRHILAGIDSTDVTPAVVSLIEKEHVLGFTLFRRNFTDASSLRALCVDLTARALRVGYPLVLAVDQEGGRVFRLPEPFSQVPPMRFFGDYVRSSGDIDVVFEIGQLLGREVRAAGFNLDFAPVADVDLNANNPIIGDRSFAADPRLVSRLSRALMCGLLSVGVLGCYKHFPGHGATTKDSHLELPVDTREFAELVKNDLKPYQDAIALGLLPSLMTAHVLYPKIDAHKPATLSPVILNEILRGQLRFQGVIFSDDLLMKAITTTEGVIPAAEEFFCAGGDVALICKSPELAQETIERLRHEAASNHELASSLVESGPRVAKLVARLNRPAPSETSLEEITSQNRFRLSTLLKKIH